MSTAELIAVVLSANFAGQRVANVLDISDAARCIPVFFKGQDRKQQIGEPGASDRAARAILQFIG